MIEKMKKFTFLLTQREYEGFLTQIRDLGVVHVQQLQQGATSQELQHAMDKAARLQAAIQFLEAARKTYIPDGKSSFATPSNGMECLERIEALKAEENRLLHEADEAEQCANRLEPWGEFRQASIARIEEACGLQVCFFRCRTKSFRNEWADEYFATPIEEHKKQLYFITFSTECPPIAAEQIQLPPLPLSHYRHTLAERHASLDNLHQEYLHLHNKCLTLLQEALLDARNDISLSHVHLSDESVAEGNLRLIVGWVKADATAPLVEYLDGAHIFYETEDPAYEDDVPIQISLNRYSRLFEPILKMYSLPNYHDIDPTNFFAPFFMLFFGLCMGDAGYGILILLASIYIACKGQPDMRAYGQLGIWLGATTILCGLATGTIFGIDLSTVDYPAINAMKPYLLNDNGIGPIFGYSPMMVISVLIGLVQVLLGMVLKGCKAIKNYGWPYAVGTFSWVLALVSAIVLYGMPVCGIELPQTAGYVLMTLIGLSTIGIFLYNNPASYKRPALGLLSNIGGGVWATYGMATGLLGDLLSYIRLFALGLTGGVLGGVFNSLALDMTASLPLFARLPLMIFILLLGHGITLALSVISAFVHPMRLTFVEFFKNADFSGGGKAYDPFRDLRKNSNKQ